MACCCSPPLVGGALGCRAGSGVETNEGTEMLRITFAFLLCFGGLTAGLYGLSDAYGQKFPEAPALPLLIVSAFIVLLGMGLANTGFIQLARLDQHPEDRIKRARLARYSWGAGALLLLVIAFLYASDHLEAWMWILGGALSGALMLFTGFAGDWAGPQAQKTDYMKYLSRDDSRAEDFFGMIRMDGATALAQVQADKSIGGLNNNSGVTPLMIASYYGQTDLMSELLNAGCDPNKQTSDVYVRGNGPPWVPGKNYMQRGATPLMFAAIKGQEKAFDLLVEKGARLDIHTSRLPRFVLDEDNPTWKAQREELSSDQGWSLLSAAVIGGMSRDKLEMLVAAGHDPNKVDGDAKSPAHYAREYENDVAKALFRGDI